VLVIVVSDAIRRLPHTGKLARPGRRGHATCYCRGGGAGGS